MKNISVFMLCIPMCVIGADKQLKRDINTVLITHHLPYDAQSMQFLKPKTRNRLPVFTEITQQHDQPAVVITQSPTPTPAFPISQTQAQPPYVIPAKRVDIIEKKQKQCRKKEVLSFIALEKIHARKSFKDGYTLYNNKGMITETRKEGSRSFSKKDVSSIIVTDDLTINIVLKGDVLKK